MMLVGKNIKRQKVSRTLIIIWRSTRGGSLGHPRHHHCYTLRQKRDRAREAENRCSAEFSDPRKPLSRSWYVCECFGCVGGGLCREFFLDMLRNDCWRISQRLMQKSACTCRREVSGFSMLADFLLHTRMVPRKTASEAN